MIRRPPRSTHCISSAASDVYKRQVRGIGDRSAIIFARLLAAGLRRNGACDGACDGAVRIRGENATRRADADASRRADTFAGFVAHVLCVCLLYTSPSPRDQA
eukprot:TRINITY_DN21141_c0_g1_i1.p4 TRINITY_DN21141_c0_g1~~TRINITY_DN21141_c0_g1_i1.p4  ORF type:complete len:103 (-),score=13.35 TRINITY_DN21141_c0_g1_i1:130-438(-)